MDDVRERFSFIPDRIAGLGELSYNLWWSWHPAARMLFKMLDRQLRLFCPASASTLTGRQTAILLQKLSHMPFVDYFGQQ